MGRHGLDYFLKLQIFYSNLRIACLEIYILNPGEDLMRLSVFAESVEKCDAVLRPRGIDIKYILTDKNPKIFDNVVNSFVGIATVQVPL